MKYVSVHHNKPTGGKTFAVILVRGNAIPVTKREYTEWLSIRLSPPLTQWWRMRKFVKRKCK